MSDLVWIELRGIIATSVNGFDTFRYAAPANRANVMISLIAPTSISNFTYRWTNNSNPLRKIGAVFRIYGLLILMTVI
jgi:hypothetical protein